MAMNFWGRMHGLMSALQRAFGVREFSVRRRFRTVYRGNLFGGEESRSGTGSSLAQTTEVRRQLPALLGRLQVREFIDAPCGDCHWIAELDWREIHYLGVDVVPEAIRANRARLGPRGLTFLAGDLCRDPLPRADLIMCRDCWVHLTFRQIADCLENFRRSGSTYLLVTTFHDRQANHDLSPGVIWRPLNLCRPPFSFPAPMEVVNENCSEDDGQFGDKVLGLWRLADLPSLT